MDKVLLFTIDFPPSKGGVAKYYEDICLNLPSEKITVLANRITDEEKFDASQKYKIYRNNLILKFPIWPKWIFSFFYLRKIIKTENIKIILVGQILPLGTVALIHKKIFKTPYAVFIHGMDLGMAQNSTRKSKLAKKILKNANFIITNSEYTKELVIGQGMSEQKIQVVYPCAETRIHANWNTNRHEFKSVSKNHCLLTVGRLVKRKGHDMVIKALPKVIKKIPNVSYIIGGDGENRAYLENLVKECNMQNYVKFLGRVDDEEKDKLYKNCNIFIMPSRNIDGDVEGFGIVYIEAASYGKPVIAGKSGGISEAVLDGETGILVNPESIDEIADAIIKLLSDSDLANKFGVRGRERALRDFNWNTQIEKIEKLLK
ncbi:MAG: glycosyltransferase family 4 protein [bacterium]